MVDKVQRAVYFYQRNRGVDKMPSGQNQREQQYQYLLREFYKLKRLNLSGNLIKLQNAYLTDLVINVVIRTLSEKHPNEMTNLCSPKRSLHV